MKKKPNEETLSQVKKLWEVIGQKESDWREAETESDRHNIEFEIKNYYEAFKDNYGDKVPRLKSEINHWWSRFDAEKKAFYNAQERQQEMDKIEREEQTLQN